MMYTIDLKRAAGNVELDYSIYVCLIVSVSARGTRA